jgi:hypothetical protein
MFYTSVGETDLFLYKGKEGLIQKIDEINMEVTRCIAYVSSFALHTHSTSSCTAPVLFPTLD